MVLGVQPQPVTSESAIVDESDWSSMSEDEKVDSLEDSTDDEVHHISVAMEDTIIYSDSEDDFQPLPELSLPEQSSKDFINQI
jgi:hypothetical protein